jgi:hypothetical protein
MKGIQKMNGLKHGVVPIDKRHECLHILKDSAQFRICDIDLEKLYTLCTEHDASFSKEFSACLTALTNVSPNLCVNSDELWRKFQQFTAKLPLSEKPIARHNVEKLKGCQMNV